jgi:hypothetical protein
VLGNDVAPGADWVAGSAVGAEDGGVAVQAGEVLNGTGVWALGGAVENVVGLVGGVPHVAPQESGGNCFESQYDREKRMVAGACLPAFPAEEVLSIPVETKEHPPGPPSTSPATMEPSE